MVISFVWRLRLCKPGHPQYFCVRTSTRHIVTYVLCAPFEYFEIGSMPLSPEYSFTQTDTTVSLHVSLKGTPKRKVDIYIADVFVKVNFAPYLLQLDLCEPVSLDKPVARFDQRDGKLHIVLLKATPDKLEKTFFSSWCGVGAVFILSIRK